MISRLPRRVAEACPFGSSLRSPHHSFGTVPPLPCRGWHAPQGHALCGGAALRTPAAPGLPTSPTSGSVPSSAVHAEARSVIPRAEKGLRAARLFPSILLILAVACSGPASYEQFVKAEDAVDGVYEFVLPVEAAVALPETSVCSDFGSSDITAAVFDLSFYTAPQAEPLQLEVTWLYSTAEVFPVSQKHGHQEQIPRENVPGPPSDMDTGNTLTAPVFSETVWFPAGQHRALYRSGITIPTGAEVSPFGSSLRSPHHSSGTVPPLPSGSPKNCRFLGCTRGCYVPQGDTSASAGPVVAGPSLISAENLEGATVLPPTFHDSGQKQGRSQEKSGDLPQIETKTWKVIVKPINPPEDFRGLGIICKKNDGTR